MRISIVMPSYNQARFVEAAIQSVLSQEYDDLEVLFIDGGSTDGTMEIVEKYRDRLAFCLSEPDQGQSDALHKGFCRATGDVLTWLNTDDLMLPGSLKKAERQFAKHPKVSWLLGNVVWIDDQDRVLKCWRGEGFTPGWMRLGLFAAGGPSAFFKKKLYERIGGINLNLHYQMDTELWWRFAMAGEKFRRLHGYTWALRLHEDAKTSGHMFAEIGNEKQKAVLKRRKEEYKHVQRLTSKFRRYQFPVVSPVLSKLRKASSPKYNLGQVESLIYRGQNISRLSARKKISQNSPT